MRDSWIGGLTDSLDALKATVKEMKGQLCHCKEGKGKEVIKVESEPLVFGYDSDDSYRTAPSTTLGATGYIINGYIVI